MSILSLDKQSPGLKTAYLCHYSPGLVRFSKTGPLESELHLNDQKFVASN